MNGSDGNEFDHHSSTYAQHAREINARLIEECPVARTSAHGGFFVVAGHRPVTTVARDDRTFSSHHDVDGGALQGITIPASPLRSGMIETDPPRFTALRRNTNPLFSPAATAGIEPALSAYASWCVDQFIEKGQADLAADLAGALPAMYTIKLLGLPFERWPLYAEAMHRGVYTVPGTPERAEVDELIGEMIQELYATCLQRQAEPRDDLISHFATMRIDDQLLPIDEVLGNAFLMLAGGVDTTTALMLHTFRHLGSDEPARQFLLADLSRLATACEEYLRWVSPVQGLARTVTSPTELAGTSLQPGDRLWLSWASVNQDPSVFEDPLQLRLDRDPNPHAAFGLGAHRCLGSHVARAMWRACVGEVLRRLPDYTVDEDAVVGYPSIGVVNGYVNMPVRFTPAAKVGASLPE